MSRAMSDLIDAAEEAATWMKDATAPNEVNGVLRKLQSAIKKAKKDLESQKRSGYLVLVELGDGRRRITATVESGNKYLSRSGIASLGIDAEVVYSAEVGDLEEARRGLKEALEKQEWAGHGMTWSELSRQDLIAAIQVVAESVGERPEGR
jgi:hypothetical protein